MSLRSISAIVACTNDYVIGKDNKLLWHLPDDLKRFKEITFNKSIIMGRKTYDSIGHPLKDRRNIIITSKSNYLVDGCKISNTIMGALYLAEKYSDEAIVIGGQSIYNLFLPYIDTLYITWVDAYMDGDTTFPRLNWSEWDKIDSRSFRRNEKNKYDTRFEILKKKILSEQREKQYRAERVSESLGF